MAFGERGAARRHDVFHPFLPHPDQVHVPLNHQNLPFPADRRERLVESVQDGTLMVHLRFRGGEVLGDGSPGGRPPPPPPSPGKNSCSASGVIPLRRRNSRAPTPAGDDRSNSRYVSEADWRIRYRSSCGRSGACPFSYRIETPYRSARSSTASPNDRLRPFTPKKKHTPPSPPPN